MKERSRNPVTKKIARERIEILFEQAQAGVFGPSRTE